MKPQTARQFATIQPEQIHFSAKLNPLLQNIRNQKIHSYFQIKDRLLNIDIDPAFQTMKVFNPQVSKKISKRGQISPMYKTMYPRRSRQPSNSPQLTQRKTKKMQMTLKKFSGRNSSQSKYSSTVKRHLISSIDFDQIEKKLFKKSENITMYEVFCSKMKQKNTDNRRTKTPSLCKPRGIPMILDDSVHRNNSFDVKLKIKKRFWLRNQEKRQKIEHQTKKLPFFSELQIGPNCYTNNKVLSRRQIAKKQEE